MNFALSVVIVALAIAGYSSKKNKIPLFIGAAFGLFGLSHFITLLGYAQPLTTALVIIRTLAYLIIVFALLRLWKL
jgi:hypothetical protein